MDPAHTAPPASPLRVSSSKALRLWMPPANRSSIASDTCCSSCSASPCFPLVARPHSRRPPAAGGPPRAGPRAPPQKLLRGAGQLQGVEVGPGERAARLLRLLQAQPPRKNGLSTRFPLSSRSSSRGPCYGGPRGLSASAGFPRPFFFGGGATRHPRVLLRVASAGLLEGGRGSEPQGTGDVWVSGWGGVCQGWGWSESWFVHCRILGEASALGWSGGGGGWS